MSRYSTVDGLVAETASQSLRIRWNGEPGQQIQLQLTIRNGTPVIDELALRRDGGDWQRLLAGITPDYAVVSGIRRMSFDQVFPLRNLNKLDKSTVDHDRWETFSDNPLDLSDADHPDNPPKEGIPVAGQPGLPRSPSEIQRASIVYHVTGCSVRSDGARLIVEFPGVDLGVFTGVLRFSVYRGTNLFRQDVVAKTNKNWVAYKFDAGLKGIPITESSRIAWRDTANIRQESKLRGGVNTGPVILRAANRLAAVEVGAGALAAFPPPHKLWPRNMTTNVGLNWYRKDSANSYTFGVLQPEHDELHVPWLVDAFGSNWTLYNARPGTDQVMTMFLYPTLGKADDAIEKSLAFTNGDHFKPLPGFQVMNHHYHAVPARRLLEEGRPDILLEDYAAIKAVGINIFSPLHEMVLINYGGAGGAPPRDEQELRKRQTEESKQALAEAKILEANRKAMSDPTFVIMQSQEVFGNPLGGHIDLLMSHAVYWDERQPGQPAEENNPAYGKVYHIGSADDLMRMVETENMVISMAHPRTKGSAGYPEAIKDRDYFASPRYLGVGMRWGMGIDGSERELCQFRCWPLLDEMSNWMAAKNLPLKRINSMSETFFTNTGDDIYGSAPVMYLKLAKLPSADDAAPIIDTLRNGYTFWTTGEVLVPKFELQGNGAKSKIVADVEWTLPLEFVEIVWGDGKTTGREEIPTTELPPFGAHHFEIPFDARGKKWVRFSAWDIAADGAVLQPVALYKP
jgi:hypothetical protein